MRPEAKALLGMVGIQWLLTFLFVSLLLFSPYLLGSDMGVSWVAYRTRMRPEVKALPGKVVEGSVRTAI